MLIAILILSGLILLTYLVFPAVVLTLGRWRPEKSYTGKAESGRLFLFMSAHNEAAVIGAKMESIVNSDYPLERLVCYIGLDDCTDGTSAIVARYKDALTLHIVEGNGRMGKPAMINKMVEEANERYRFEDADILLMTDANVLFRSDFIAQLITAFNDPGTGLADGVAQHPDSATGVARSERTYLQLESALKHAEGKLWGCSMGPFGGAYMMRATAYTPVPGNFLVDDFFIFYEVIRKGWKTRVVPEAVCYEYVGEEMAEEFRRKKRIAAGNFQNAGYFFSEMIQLWKPANLVFVLHKLLRWLTPVFGAVLLILLAVLSFGNPSAFLALLIMICLLVGIPLLNYLSNQLNLNLRILQGAAYFIVMNVAVLLGFFKYLKGVRSNVWEPTKRNLSIGYDRIGD